MSTRLSAVAVVSAHARVRVTGSSPWPTARPAGDGSALLARCSATPMATTSRSSLPCGRCTAIAAARGPFRAAPWTKARAPLEAALREFAEEVGPLNSSYQVAELHEDDHGGWSYWTVVIDVDERFEPPPVQSWETDDVRWIGADEVHTLDLFPEFHATLRKLGSIAYCPRASHSSVVFVCGNGSSGTGTPSALADRTPPFGRLPLEQPARVRLLAHVGVVRLVGGDGLVLVDESRRRRRCWRTVRRPSPPTDRRAARSRSPERSWRWRS